MTDKTETQIRREIVQEVYGRLYESLAPAIARYDDELRKAYDLKVEGKTYEAEDKVRQAGYQLRIAAYELTTAATKYYRRPS